MSMHEAQQVEETNHIEPVKQSVHWCGVEDLWYKGRQRDNRSLIEYELWGSSPSWNQPHLQS